MISLSGDAHRWRISGDPNIFQRIACPSLLCQWGIVSMALLRSRASWTRFNKVEIPRWCSGKESACQCRKGKRCRFNLWVRKIPWSRKWQPTSVFLPGKSHGQRSLGGRLQSMGFQRVGHDRVCMCAKYHKLGTLKQQNFFSVTFWRSEVWNQWAGLCSFWNLQGRRFPWLFQLLVLPTVLGHPWIQMHHSNLCLCHLMAFSPPVCVYMGMCVCVCMGVCVCVCDYMAFPVWISLCLSFEDTSHVTLRTHPNPVCP